MKPNSQRTKGIKRTCKLQKKKTIFIKPCDKSAGFIIMNHSDYVQAAEKKPFEQNRIMLRFLEDIFKIFVGTSKYLHMLFNEMNQIHPSIKLTMNHTSNSKET